MSNSPICFVDTEATGLRPDDEIWEFAGRRRNPDGTTDELHLFISHATHKAQHLPTSFYQDWLERYPHRDYKLCVDQTVASREIQAFTLGATIVGLVPSFDTEKIAKMMRGHGIEPKWHYHIVDCENLIVGFLAARGNVLKPPWRSDQLSGLVGVDVTNYARHTAMGDVLWTEAMWDAVMGAAK